MQRPGPQGPHLAPEWVTHWQALGSDIWAAAPLLTPAVQPRALRSSMNIRPVPPACLGLGAESSA